MKKYFANKTPAVTDMEKQGAALASEVFAEGIVLLENRDFLPLVVGKNLALFGMGARNTLYGGLGAASIHIRHGISIEEGLETEGFRVMNKGYLDRRAAVLRAEEETYYRNIRDRCGDDLLAGVLRMYAEPFCAASHVEITQADLAQGKTDTAVYVISRCSGEGADRKPVPGDYELSEDERTELTVLESNYQHLVVLLNTCGVIDTKFIRRLKNLKALLFIGMGAACTGSVVAGVLSGRINPSGKLTTTWAENYMDYPSAATYGATDGDLDDEFYREGIYVGYRWFDDMHIRPAYCFGYGLSYTNFQIQPLDFVRDSDSIALSAAVTNVGRCAGKEVVQIYVHQPEGKIRKVVKLLAGFEKTRLLPAGESQEVRLSFSIRDFSSYDEDQSAWILESGNYVFYVATSAENLVPAGVLRLDQTVMVEQCAGICPDDEKLRETGAEPIVLRDGYGSLPDAHHVPILSLSASEIACERHSYGESGKPVSAFSSPVSLRMKDFLTGQVSAEQLAGNLSLDELVHLLVGRVPEQTGVSRRASVFTAGISSSTSELEDTTEWICAGASETTASLLTTRGIPKLNLADGGSGLRLIPEFQTDVSGNLATSGLFSIGNVDRFAGDVLHQENGGEHFWQYPTAFPMAMVMAQSWNKALLEKVGQIIGREADAYGVDIWLAPSMNIHRNPLCGRNYEYYSEDPVITGESASAVLTGFQQCRYAAACIKHLACNNQEDNRNANNVHLSEQTLREIYLRGFEIAVRKCHPHCVMTSLNLIHGQHTANQYDLLTTVLREEWGFDGIVMTDWGTTVLDPDEVHKYGCASAPGCVNAGNDLIMPGTPQDIQALHDAVESGQLDIGLLRLSVSRMLRLMASQIREET